ncbi:hypothetical protein [Nitrincola tapanii]|uniref:Uncharacterized protein n=1 Tax=Nitrincola tapanii TaxID=1708751 RepID=A0A5A9W4S8_9GAMM|nr:hypothetical protein [Nitrincola tapanii]KAA0875642.1 hypothetical protein E1H14_02795 [Nitrincola tapanii]
MKKRLLTSLIAAAVALPAQAAEYRLAFSQSAQLEVFVEHADGVAWCAPSLTLRFQDKGAADKAVLEQMMPRIGALIDRECPAAKEARWYSIAAEGNTLQQGQITQAAGWQLTSAPAQVAASPAPSAPLPPGPNVAAVAAPEVTAPVVAVEADQVAAPAPEAVAAETVAATAEAPQAAEAQVAEVQITETPAAEVIAAQVAEVIAPEPTAAPPMFAVADWMPRSSADTLAAQSFSLPLKDQQGCVFNTNLSFNVTAEFIRNQSSGIHCAEDGLAQGQGQWQISRSDGMNLGRIEAVFKDGQAFINIRPDFTLQHILANQFIYVYLGSDSARQVHYLAEGRYHGPSAAWNFERPRLLALTEKIDLFRDAEQIQAVIQVGNEKLAPLVGSRVSHISFTALKAPQAWFEGNHHNQNPDLLYSITLNKPYRQEHFVFNLQQGNNHLFEREHREALAAQREQERLERERLQQEAQAQRERQFAAQREAQRQSQALNQFEYLNRQTDAQRLQDWVREVEFDLFGGDYLRLMKGSQLEYRQIIQVGRKAQEGEWSVEAPYPALLQSAEELKSGWYQFTGTLRLDAKRQDKQGLPLSVLTPQLLSPCADSRCLDQFNALQIMRSQMGDANWSPEAAQAVITRFESGDYE